MDKLTWLDLLALANRIYYRPHTFSQVSINISGEGGYPISGLGRGGTPSQVWVGGVPHLSPGEYPISGPGGRGYPMSGGVPHVWRGTPCPGGYNIYGGYPHVWGGTPSPPPIAQSSIASTCYAAGGVPLAFTQEDFLVC